MWTYKHDWKHYLPETWLAGGNKIFVSEIWPRTSTALQCGTADGTFWSWRTNISSISKSRPTIETIESHSINQTNRLPSPCATTPPPVPRPTMWPQTLAHTLEPWHPVGGALKSDWSVFLYGYNGCLWVIFSPAGQKMNLIKQYS